MTKLPFPFPFRVGADIVSIQRISTIITKSQAERFANKILHPMEIKWLDEKVQGWRSINSLNSPTSRRLETFLAGRWAAKEAARKAIGAHLLTQKQVRISSDENGATEVIYPVIDARGETVEQTGICSISHETDYAVASVIAVPIASVGQATSQ